ncbi:M23 family metallopeptidase [Auritidibacter ignavus]|uniref:M23 family metallopeptidase n=1 Tax=Auritidibacter ignavus TaxID=678932 RepID=UPI00109CF663|nr:M23 family metallopeptidase [Auritidibacter ignavus]
MKRSEGVSTDGTEADHHSRGASAPAVHRLRRILSTLRPLWRMLILAGLLLIVADLTGLFNPPGGFGWVLAVIVLVLTGCLLVGIAPATPDRAPVVLRPPVRGRWLATSSPGQQLPSHGTATRGQFAAVDLAHPSVAEDMTTTINPADVRLVGRGTRPEEFTCFGEPVYAIADGTVLQAADRQRDKRARDTWLGRILMLLLEGPASEFFGGYRAIFGNRVVVQHDDGTFAAYAHLRRDSVVVVPGQRVRAGEQLAEVGNTGNTTEPHLHVQLMDRGSVDAAAGLPFVWSGVELGDLDPAWKPFAKDRAANAVTEMPRNGQIFQVVESGSGG